MLLAVLLSSVVGSPVSGAPVAPAAPRFPTPDAPDPAVVARVRQGVVRIAATVNGVQPDGSIGSGFSSGSGFVISEDGLVVTNYHVIAGGGDTVDVYLDREDTPWPGRVLGYSECSDLAVLRIDAPGLVPLVWAASSPEVGRGVLAAGYPDGDPRFALMEGFVARESGPLPNEWSSVERAFEHTAQIRPGDSGGPLVDAVTGEVLGVDYSFREEGARAFAIDVAEASVVVSLLSQGLLVGSFGVGGRAVLPGDAAPPFILVESVAPRSRAEVTGITAGDIITSLAGAAPATDGTMADYCHVAQTSNGSPIDLELVRGSRTLEGQIDGLPLREVADIPIQTRGVAGWTPFSLVTDWPDAGSPRMSRDPDGDLAIVWAAPRHPDGPGIYLSRQTTGGGWQTERVTRGRDSDPWVTTDDAGRFHVVFARARTSNGAAGIFYATDRSGSWEVSRLSRGDDMSPVVRVSGRTIHVAFRRDEDRVFYMRRVGSGDWTRKSFLARSGCCGVVLRVDDAGKVHLAWNTTPSILYVTNRGGRWRTRHWVSREGSVGTPSMTIGADQVPRLVFRDGDSLVFAVLRDPDVTTLRTEVIASKDGAYLGGTFAEPRIIMDGTRPVVAWSNFLGDVGIYLARRRGGQWQVEWLIDGSQDSSPSLIATDGTLHLAFAERYLGIWYTHD